MFCPGCGSEVASIALACPRCGQAGPAPGPPPLPTRPVPAGEYFFPRNGPALAAYYLGVFSLLPAVGIVLGILAIVFGVKGVRLERAHPEARGGMHARVGLVLGAVFGLGQVVVLGLILLGAFAKR